MGDESDAAAVEWCMSLLDCWIPPISDPRGVPTSPDLDSESRSPESACERDSIWKSNRIGLAATSCERLSPKALATCTGEHAFQESLSRHTEYLPHLANTHHGVWFDWVLYKLRLPSGNEVDFAYVETTSVLTTVLLIEIEDPAKSMWVGSLQKPAKSADFSRAIEQVTRWRADLRDPAQLLALKELVTKLLGNSGMIQNAIDVQYGLVYGRGAENSSDERRAAYADLQQTLGIHLMTYDHLVTRHQKSPGRVKNVVRLTYPGPIFSYAYLNAPPAESSPI